ncbi:KipI antagonist [Pullulanibacillus camelliae]|uniref:KipI antagonist n=1 Tax=Pullulanibacillus camelliae TaxID=1707096 RepID=A0A8J2YK46_9BACL|nr:biotin-dependent carboxyltransferase family protein [Pullulanibacillus camelliae]GGE49611.1 KipI antagonist [Pullulanibacillus camelliae]
MINIIDAGLNTTVQDLGRWGYQDKGITVGGALDHIALRLANLLVGNPENTAGLEMTLLGPTLSFTEDALIAICGGDLDARIDEKSIKTWSPLYIKKGSILRLGSAKRGCRAYLAVHGGIDVPSIMGSKSTDLRSSFGGFNGRSLREKDELPIGEPHSFFSTYREQCMQNHGSFHSAKWSISYSGRLAYSPHPTLRVLPGKEHSMFTDSSIAHFYNEAYQITSASNRMGYRLKGAPLYYKTALNLLTEPVTTGTIQIPSDGQPIILLADRQTSGGYPRIGHVIQADLPLIGQTKPGDAIYFKAASLEEAYQALAEQEKQIKQIKRMIHMKLVKE